MWWACFDRATSGQPLDTDNLKLNVMNLYNNFWNFQIFLGSRLKPTIKLLIGSRSLKKKYNSSFARKWRGPLDIIQPTPIRSRRVLAWPDYNESLVRPRSLAISWKMNGSVKVRLLVFLIVSFLKHKQGEDERALVLRGCVHTISLYLKQGSLNPARRRDETRKSTV